MRWFRSTNSLMTMCFIKKSAISRVNTVREHFRLNHSFHHAWNCHEPWSRIPYQPFSIPAVICLCTTESRTLDIEQQKFISKQWTSKKAEKSQQFLSNAFNCHFPDFCKTIFTFSYKLYLIKQAMKAFFFQVIRIVYRQSETATKTPSSTAKTNFQIYISI